MAGISDKSPPGIRHVNGSKVNSASDECIVGRFCHLEIPLSLYMLSSHEDYP